MSKKRVSNMEGRLLPGIKPVLELLEQDPDRVEKIYCKKNMHGLQGQRLLALCRKHKARLEWVEQAFLDSICGTDQREAVSHQGVVAALSEASFVSLKDLLEVTPNAPLPVIMALDQVQDPGNVGALCRTAYALGCAGMILPRHNSASLGPAALRSSAGALRKMPCAIVTNLAHALDEAEENGFTIYGAGCQEREAAAISKSARACSSADAFEHTWLFPAVITLGNESKGIRDGVAKRCGIFVNIPFARNFDSLNVAQAGAIILGLCSRQQNSRQ